MIMLVLRNRFIFRPGLLSDVIGHFAGLEHTFKLFRLVNEYVPEARQKLLKMSNDEAAREFIKLFSKRYFPISIDSSWYGGMTGIAIERLASHIPLQWHGMQGMQDYSPARWNAMFKAQLLAEAILACPSENPNARIAVLEEYSKLVGEDTAKRLIPLLPGGGYQTGALLEDVEDALEASPYPGLLAWCRWVYNHTGCAWLDNTDGGRDWSRENVDRLAADWPKYLALYKEMKAFNSWLGHDFAGRSAQVIRYVAERIKRKPKTLAEVLNDSESVNRSANSSENESEN